MTRDQIVVGRTYVIRHHTGFLTPVTVEKKTLANAGRLRYACKNELTGRAIVVKSSTKFQYEVARDASGKWQKIVAPLSVDAIFKGLGV